MTQERALLLLTFLGVIAMKVGTLEHGWHEALTPQFIGATLAEIVVALRLTFTKGKDER